jgi:carbon storage regulator
MLVLTRKAEQEIVVGGNVRVTVLAVKGDKIRVGIEAPPNIRVDRGEIHEKRQHTEVEIAEDFLQLA